jgi:hypothetical protein
MSRFQLIVIILCCLIFQSCYITESIPNRVLISKLAENKCDSVDTAKTFFSYYNGEKIDFEYIPISMITVSNGNQSQGNMLVELKQNAISQCADGMINITQDINEGKYKQEDIWDKNSKVEYKTYNIQKYSGLAVKLKDKLNSKTKVDSLYYVELDKSKEKAIRDKIYMQESKSDAGGALAVFSIIAVLGTLVFYEAVIRP